MKCFKLAVIILLCGAYEVISAQPRYISYENLYGVSPISETEGRKTAHRRALDLAKLLDKGTYKGELIRTTTVLNYNNREFFVAATLASGKTVKLYINVLQHASRTGELLLAGNRYLVFPEVSSADFVVFDKSSFYNQALGAKYFKKIYPTGHPLEGKAFFYEIKRFRKAPNNENLYIIELLNGAEEKIDINQAYQVLEDNLLLVSINKSSLPVFGDTFWLKNIRGFNKIPYDLPGVAQNNVKKFGIHLVFNNDVEYRKDDFQILIHKLKDNFYLDVIIPNANPTRGITVENDKNLEYLKDVQVLNSPEGGFITLRSSFFSSNFDSIDFLERSPEVIIHPDLKNVFIVFSQDIDQTIDYNIYDLSEGQVEASRKIAQDSLKQLKGQESLSAFGKAYNQVVVNYNLSLATKGWQNWKNNFQKLMQDFLNAGGYATTEKELALALAGRDLCMDHVFNGILVGDVYPVIKSNGFSQNAELVDYIYSLKRYAKSNKAKDNFIENLKILYLIDNKLNLLDDVLYGVNVKTSDFQDLKQRYIAIINAQLSDLGKLKPATRELSVVKNNLVVLAEELQLKFRD